MHMQLFQFIIKSSRSGTTFRCFAWCPDAAPLSDAALFCVFAVAMHGTLGPFHAVAMSGRLGPFSVWSRGFQSPAISRAFVRSPGCELAMGTVSAATSFLVPVSLSIFLHHARVQCRERYACTSLDVTAAAYMHACVLRGAVGGGETDDVIIEYCL